MTARLLGDLLASAGGDARLALAMYAQGGGSVRANGPTALTRQVVDEIVAMRPQFASSAPRDAERP